MHALCSDDCERIEGHVAVSAMVGGGQHAQPERMLTRQAYYSIKSICFVRTRSTVKSDPSYSFQFNEMARPAGLEPAAFCLEVMQYKTLSAASGVAYEGARHLSRP